MHSSSHRDHADFGGSHPLAAWSPMSLLDNLIDAVVVVGAEGEVLHVNMAFEQLTGLRAEDAIGHLLNTLLPCKNTWLWDAICVGRSWRGEMHCVLYGNRAFDADVTVTPLRSAGGQAQRFVLLVRDVTHLKDVQRFKGRFVSQVSNELRGPITHLKTYLTLLQRGKPEKREQYLEVVRQEVVHLETLIEDVFSLSQLDLTDAGQLERQRVDLNSLVSQMAQRFGLAAADQRIILEQDLDHNLPHVEVSVGLVIQALTNLVDNAITHTPAGGRVTLKTGVMKRGGDLCAAVIVADTGQGIMPAERSRLFEPFARDQAGQASGIPGSGLGLPIAYQIARLHGGDIDVRSEGVPGKGSTFTFFLPLSPDPKGDSL